MNKRFLTVLLACIMIFTLSACGETISKYKNNESDNFFTEEHTEGGNQDIANAYLEKISFTRILGPEKLIFTIKNEDSTINDIPYFTVDVTENGALISGVIYNCKATEAQNYEQGNSGCIESYEVNENGGNIYFTIKLNDNVKTSIYNNEVGKLVFSFKFIYPTQ